MRAKQGTQCRGRFVWSDRPLWERTKQFSHLIYQAIARFAELTGRHFERRNAIPQCPFLLHGNSNPFAVLKSQSFKQIVLNYTSAIDKTEGAIKRLTPPERFVLLFWQAFKKVAVSGDSALPSRLCANRPRYQSAW